MEIRANPDSRWSCRSKEWGARVPTALTTESEGGYMLRRSIPIVAASVWVSLTGLSGFTPQPASGVAVGTATIRDTACAARVSAFLGRDNPLSAERDRFGLRVVNLDLKSNARTTESYQVRYPQYARLNRVGVVAARGFPRGNAIAPAVADAKRASRTTGGASLSLPTETSRIARAVMGQPCLGAHSQH